MVLSSEVVVHEAGMTLRLSERLYTQNGVIPDARPQGQAA
jgi:hypothetical protein